ncbi:MAG: two-component system response regulator [Pedosphaera sp.]|nr:two-component system response regulator [Pedosphaera sp.]
MNRGRHKFRVLVADDFAEHGIMLACAMRQTQTLQMIHTVTTRREAFRYLVGEGSYSNRSRFPFPEVVITELGMPCLETVKLLAAMGMDGFKRPLRIVLTCSPLPEHRRQAGRMGMDAYFTMPESFHGLVDIAREIERMLLRTHEPPRLKAPAAKRAVRPRHSGATLG